MSTPLDSFSDSFSGGFADPVFDSQATFRAILDALSRPGSIVALEPRSRPPKPITPAAADILCALADQDTCVYLGLPPATLRAAGDWVRFQTGAVLTTDPARADFVLATGPRTLPSLSQFPAGSAEYPDRSATVVLQLDSLTLGEEIRLSGPGIRGEQRFAPSGLPAGFIGQLEANHGLYPRGLDLLFVGREGLAGLPRSTAIRRSEG